MTPGIHRGIVTAWALGTTSKGGEQVAVTFQLPDSENETIVWRGYFTEKSTDITFKALRAMGWQGDDLADLSSIEGHEASLTIEPEEYEGKTFLKVRWVNPISGPVLKEQMAPDAAKAFAARMKARIRAFDASEGKPKVNGKPASKKASLPPEPPPITEDDSLPNF